MTKKEKAEILKLLKSQKVDKVTLKYEGSEDSGNVYLESVVKGKKVFEYTWERENGGSVLKCGTEVLKFDKVKAKEKSSTFNQDKKKWEDRYEEVEKTIDSHLENFGYSFLERYGGWEINDGSDGEITIDVKEKKISNTHRSYRTECDTEEVEL